MNRFMKSLHDQLPQWAADWFDVLVPTLQVLLILMAALMVMRIARHLIRKLTVTYGLPVKFASMSRRVVGFVVWAGAILWVLERLGVSGGVLWTAFTGFATVGAVAFFAAWSVLSNLFCALLIYTTRAFRIGETVELLENSEKPGLKGQVVEINLVYTTLHEAHPDGAGSTLQVPNSLFFQRVLRRWYGAASSSLG
jgi:small-conductance mechanosensitive channel